MVTLFRRLQMILNLIAKAKDLFFNNSASGLEATNVQDGMDLLATKTSKLSLNGSKYSGNVIYDKNGNDITETYLTVGGSAVALIQKELKNEDLNDIKPSVVTYYFAAGGNSCVNNPESGKGFGMIAYKNAAGYYCQEIYSQSSVKYIRYYNGSSWSTKKIAYSDETLLKNDGIGTVNLYNGTKDLSGSDWINKDGYIADETYKGFKVWKKNNAWGGACQTINAVVGEKYVFSCWAKVGTSASGVTATAQFFTRNNDQTNGNNSTQDGKIQSVSSEWQRIVIPFTVRTTGTMQPRIENTKANSGGLYVCGIKLERGEVASDWFYSVNDIFDLQEELKNEVEKMNGLILWNNTSNSITEETISIDLTNIKAIEIQYIKKYYSNPGTYGLVKATTGKVELDTTANEIIQLTRLYPRTGNLGGLRDIRILRTDNQITICNGKEFDKSFNAEDSDTVCVPTKIIGYYY